MRPQHPQAPLTEEQRSLASSIELARQQNAKNLDKAVLMIELRKWCVEKGVEGMKTTSVWFNEKDGATRFYALELAQEFYEWVSAPIQE